MKSGQACTVIDIDALIAISGSFDVLLGLIYAGRNRMVYEQCQTERQKVVAARHGLSESRVKAIVAEVKRTIAKEGVVHAE